MAEGFLGRWSQRKLAVREGKPVKDAVDPVVATATSAATITPEAGLTRSDARLGRQASDPGRAEPSTPATETPQPAPPSMQDVAALNADSDFKPFIARAVAPEVRNAAMKKLFADPHFNVMDGLDIYIDDYSIPDPLPASMLRKMVSAQFLNLFDDEEAPARGLPGPDFPMDDAPVAAQAEPIAPLDPAMRESGDTAIGTSDADSIPTPAIDPDKTDPSV